MSRFDLKVRVSLEGLADGWTKDHYLEFASFSAADSLDSGDELKGIKDEDTRGMIEVFKKYAKKQFAGGKVLVAGETVDAEVDDLEALPAPVITNIFTVVSRSEFSNPKA
ncbi:hypothetical protein [Rhodococcus rhodochrous]|uniref:hypothetical protein n=1 Tax=Rhodococcus rhodochrous TaxID=1829 RepID=UPI00177BCD53|nr:hypothetical protein [Rhodococcus rhodochrous]QOH56255.1 hypothetical protein C6Y44_09965 [Rhodococcus rhodochrous]